MAGRKSSRIELTCEVCSDKFHAKPSEVKKGARFCSMTCYGRSKRVERIDRTCEVCGTHFESYPRIVAEGGARFCSKDCHKSRPTVPLTERFYRYVGPVTGTGCILWTGAVSIGGYGIIGSGIAKGDYVYANRLSYEIFIGPIPESLFALHRCDNPPCVNPFHLFLGTHLDNARDKVAKGRQPKGENHGRAKLTDERVLAIRERYYRGDVGQEQLASDNGVSINTIARIVNHRNWTHL